MNCCKLGVGFGSASYVYAERLSLTNYWTARGFTDIDHDGTTDIIYHGTGGESCYWLLNTNGTMRGLGGYISPVLASPSY